MRIIIKVELLYFDGCPSWQTAHENLLAALAGLGSGCEVALVRVETQAEALAHRFAGSPTIRVNGQDLFPVGHTDYALGCRVYQTPEGLRGSPTVETIRERIAESLGQT